MAHKNIYDQIEQYLASELSPEAARIFEAEMAADANLKREVDKHRLSHETVEILIEDNLRRKLEELRSKEQSASKGARIIQMPRMQRVWAAAAVVVLLIGVFTWRWVDSFSNDRLVAAYFEPLAPQSLRFGESESALRDGQTAFEEGEYTEAIRLLEAIPPENDYYAEAQYILGHSYFQLADYPSAITAFQTTIALNHPRLNDKTEWNLLLAFLKNDDMGQSFQTLLDTIAGNPNHSFHAPANELKVKLGSFWRGLVE